jgi:hypothetical protein
MVAAVTRQLDEHSPRISALLTTMRNSNLSLIEDAVYQEIQTLPSTSLISRSMIRVAGGSNGFPACLIDTRSLGIAPRIIPAWPTLIRVQNLIGREFA